MLCSHLVDGLVSKMSTSVLTLLQDVAALCNISAMPTFQVWQGGAKVDQVLGANPANLEALVAKYA